MVKITSYADPSAFSFQDFKNLGNPSIGDLLIIGIGTDIVFVPRIIRIHKRFGDSFARRILEEKEYEEYQKIKDRNTRAVYFLAKHFAAKEAAVKALGTGFSKDVGYHDVCITHTKEGKPCLQIATGVSRVLQIKGKLHFHLSLSDEAESVIAFVIIEKIS